MTDLTDQQIEALRIENARLRKIVGGDGKLEEALGVTLGSHGKALIAATAERDALAARLASAETDAVERHRLFNIAKDQRDIMAKRATRAEARLAAVEKLMAATITPSGGEGCVTVANLRTALAADTTLRTVDRDRSTAREPSGPQPCRACRGSGRCSDMTCDCLADVCAYCNGSGSAIPEQEAGNDE